MLKDIKKFHIFHQAGVAGAWVQGRSTVTNSIAFEVFLSVKDFKDQIEMLDIIALVLYFIPLVNRFT